jgi:hypothetical protein
MPYVATGGVDPGICRFAVDHGIDLTRGARDAMIYLSTNRAPRFATMRGLINMTTYTTRTLSEAVIGADDKASTRTLRKFLRADITAKGGKVGIDTPGKGGRYTLDMNKRELNALIKRFAAWQVAEEEAKTKRAAELAAKGAIILPADDASDEDALAENEESDKGVEGPSDEEIAAMIADGDDEAIEDEEEEEEIEGESF